MHSSADHPLRCIPLDHQSAQCVLKRKENSGQPLGGRIRTEQGQIKQQKQQQQHYRYSNRRTAQPPVDPEMPFLYPVLPIYQQILFSNTVCLMLIPIYGGGKIPLGGGGHCIFCFWLPRQIRNNLSYLPFQLIDPLPVPCANPDHRQSQFFPEGCQIDPDPLTGCFIHQVDTHNRSFAQASHLQYQHQTAGKTCGITHHNHCIISTVVQEIGCYHFIRRTMAERIGAGQVDQHPPSLFIVNRAAGTFNRFSSPVTCVLM